MPDIPAGPAPLIHLHADDSVAVARVAVDPAVSPIADGILLRDRITRGRKGALSTVAAGQPVQEYGQLTGFASRDIAAGGRVHTQEAGRGSVSGFRPAPSLKRATNTPICERMSEDVDIDCGTIVTGDKTIVTGERIFVAILAAASAEKTPSEIRDHGDNEFVPWQVGAVMQRAKPWTRGRPRRTPRKGGH